MSFTCDRCGSNDGYRTYCGHCYDALEQKIRDLESRIRELESENYSLRQHERY